MPTATGKKGKASQAALADDLQTNGAMPLRRSARARPATAAPDARKAAKTGAVVTAAAPAAVAGAPVPAAAAVTPLRPSAMPRASPLSSGDDVYGCRSWTKFVPSDPRRDPRLRDECDTVPPIFTHPANAPRLTMVTPITRRRIKAAYLWAGLAGLGLGDTLCSHVVRKVQKISYLRI